MAPKEVTIYSLIPFIQPQLIVLPERGRRYALPARSKQKEAGRYCPALVYIIISGGD